MTELAAAAAKNVEGGVLDKHSPQIGLSLVFAEGERPSASDIERLLESESVSGLGATISHRPDESAGWLEMLVSGLTFDLKGLAPASGAGPPDARHFFGLPREAAEAPCEAIAIVPGPNLEGGGAMMPVVRTMAGLAASLALVLPVRAVCWHPAQSWIETQYFARTIVSWLSGGVFPALGLTAVEPAGEGSVRSVGLSFFTGQEVQVEAEESEPPSETVKLAVRVIDHLIKQGPLDTLTELHGPSGEPLLAEPSSDGRRVRVWRGT